MTIQTLLMFLTSDYLQGLCLDALIGGALKELWPAHLVLLFHGWSIIEMPKLKE